MQQGRTYRYPAHPSFVVDPQSVVRSSGRQIAWQYVTDAYRQNVLKVKLNGAASSTDTSLTVDALPAVPGKVNPLEVGDLLYFGEAGEEARVTAPAAAGATTVSVEALAANIEDNDEAPIPGSGGGKFIQAGTVMAELSGGQVVPRAIRPGSETAKGLLETDAAENDRDAAASGYGMIVGGFFYENLLPEASGSPAVLDSTFKTELQTAGVGTGFGFEQFGDSRAT